MASARPKPERGRLELQEIKRLIEMIERSPITEFELVDKDLRIRISKNGKESAPVQVMAAPAAAAVAPALVTPPAMPDGQTAVAPPAPARAVSFAEVKSPMVGTMYRAPAPDAEPYVRVGDKVEPGKVLCIVEAMKLMNELESEVSGRIVEICVENAQPVEFGQVLFRIDTSA